MPKHINLSNARKKEQKTIMGRIKLDGVCPFCIENFEKYHTKPIIFETPHWIITKNAWPYANTAQHYLCVAKKHVFHPTALTPAAWSDLYKSIKKLEKKNGLKRGTLLMRFGPSAYTGATVEHLHAQIVVAKSKDQPVTTRVG